MADYPDPPDDSTGAAPPPEWLDALEDAEGDVAAGDFTPWAEARARLLATLADLEARQAKRRA